MANSNHTSSWAGFIGFISFFLIFTGGCMFTHAKRETMIITVTDKERTSEKFLIFTDGLVLECTDSLVEGKMNSSDIYGSMKIGKTYRVRAYGFRFPLFSMYQNILWAVEVQH